MLVSTALNKAYLEATGKVNLVAGSSKYLALLAYADNAQQEWQNSLGGEWDSLYQSVTTGTLSTASSYDLDDTIRVISKQEQNSVRIVSPDKTKTTNYTIIRPEKMQYFNGQNATGNSSLTCTIIGRQLVFPGTFPATDTKIGYSIVIPAFINVDTITSDRQTIQVDDPMWMVYTIAAKYCANKLSLNYKVQDLETKAQARMASMMQQQDSQIEEVPIIGNDYYSPESYGSSSQEAWYV